MRYQSLDSEHSELSNLSYARKSALAVTLAGALATPPLCAQMLEEVIVTAQKREVGLQDSALSVAALTGDTLEKSGILSASDLSNSVAGFSMTAGTPFDAELNIRGITNTRIDAPTASPSVGIFIDDVYVSRTGLLNMDFYDIERVEIIRGPQGVLLGKNVVGGALSVITAKPEFDTSAKVNVALGNFSSQLVTGYVTGALSERLAGRLSVQKRTQDGYATNVLTQQDLHNIDSLQARGSLLYEDDGNDFSARVTYEYLRDRGNSVLEY